MTLEFPAGVPSVDVSQGLLLFNGNADDLTIRCAVTEIALLDRANLRAARQPVLRKLFHENWQTIREIVRTKFERGDLKFGAVVVVSSDDLNDACAATAPPDQPEIAP
jgi:hypothetical protein